MERILELLQMEEKLENHLLLELIQCMEETIHEQLLL
jgi:hypothetical protein